LTGKFVLGGWLLRHREFYVYIMSSETGTLYIGVTNDLARRVHEHKNKLIEGSTGRYNITRTGDMMSAIEREKQLKKWRRDKKIALIESANPGWADLSAEILSA
jgi:putative endonuclease